MKFEYFLNISNHPSDKWGEKQISSALELADGIIDLPFPNINPEWDSVNYSHLNLRDMVKKISKDAELSSAIKQFSMYYNNQNTIIMVQGEMSFTHYLVNILQNDGYTVVCSTTERNTVENADGTKTVKFEFCRFREYQKPATNYFNIFQHYAGIAVITSRLESVSKPAGERRQGSEYSTANYLYGFIAYNKAGEITRWTVEYSLNEVISECKARDFKIISDDEWKIWEKNAGLNPDLIFEGIK